MKDREYWHFWANACRGPCRGNLNPRQGDLSDVAAAFETSLLLVSNGPRPHAPVSDRSKYSLGHRAGRGAAIAPFCLSCFVSQEKSVSQQSPLSQV